MSFREVFVGWVVVEADIGGQVIVGDYRLMLGKVFFFWLAVEADAEADVLKMMIGWLAIEANAVANVVADAEADADVGTLHDAQLIVGAPFC